MSYVDPQAQAILDARTKRPKQNRILDDAGYVGAMRAGLRIYLASDDGPAGPSESVGHVQDTTILSPHGALSARLYRSSGYEGGPLVIWFHGGGFIAGDLDTHDRQLRVLANRGRCTVLSVAYRLAPEHPYPAAIEDAYTAWFVDILYQPPTP